MNSILWGRREESKIKGKIQRKALTVAAWQVPTELESWPEKEGVRQASINNFGYGGSNAHVIMQDLRSFLASSSSSTQNSATARDSVQASTNGNGHSNGHSVANGITNGHSHDTNGTNGHLNGHGNTDSDLVNARSRVFMLSAKDERATKAMLDNLKEYLLTTATKSSHSEDAFLDNLAYTLGHRRSLFPWRATLSASSVAGLVKTIQSGRAKPTKTETPPRLGFVYTGQGAQWWAMGRELIDVYSVFKATLLDCDVELKKLGASWNMIGTYPLPFRPTPLPSSCPHPSPNVQHQLTGDPLVEELNRDPETSRVNELDYSTPVCVAVQIALTELLRAWGINPTAVTSHSSGEIAAAYIAGALDLVSAMAIAYARGGLTSESSRQSAQKGGMVAVGLGPADSQKYISRVSNGKVVLACENSPSSSTISGDVSGLDQLEALLKKDNVFARRLKVDAAWHSHHMNAVADAYYASMDGKVRPAQDTLDMVFSSPATGARLDDAEAIGSPAHWVRSLTGPVRFVEAFSSMCFDGSDTEPAVDMVIEVGPHAALSGPIQDIFGMPQFRNLTIPYATCLIRKQNAVDTMHALVGSLIQNGYPVNLAAVNFPFGKQGLTVLHDLPHYPWNHQIRHWQEPRLNKALRGRSDRPHDLLGSMTLGANMNAPTWRHFIRLNELPWVRDHVVQATVVYPAAGYLCMAIEGASRLSSYQALHRHIKGYHLRDVDIINVLIVPDTRDGVELQLALRPCSDRALDTKGWLEFQVQSVTLDNKWTEHCKGLIIVEYTSEGGLELNSSRPSAVRRHVKQPADEAAYRSYISPRDLYATLRSGGISHGPIFQNVHSIRARTRQSVTSFIVADSESTMPKNHQHPHVVHPTTLDSVFQAAYTAVPGAGSILGTPKVPRSIRKLWVAQSISAVAGHPFKAYTDLAHSDSQTMSTSITVADGLTDTNDTFQSPVISIEDLVYQSIGSAPLNAAPAWEQDKFSIAKWVPDIAFMKDSYVKKQLGSGISGKEAELLADLRRACVFYIQHVLNELTTADIKHMEPHHRKFYLWMRLQAELAKSNELAPGSNDWITATPKERARALDKVRRSSTNGEMVCKLGSHIASILRGEITALEVMLEDNLLNRYYLDGVQGRRANAKLGELVALYTHKYPRAKMIEIGGGTGGATTQILDTLERIGSRNIASYDFTDVSSGFFEAAKDKFQDWNNIMRFKKLDIEQDPASQGFEEGTYDVVIACQVLHATVAMQKTMTNARKLLKPGGKLFIVETTNGQVDTQFIFGFLQGWWLSKFISISDPKIGERMLTTEIGEDEERKLSPTLSIPMWDRVLRQTGFRGVETEVHDCDNDDLYTFSVISSTAVGDRPKFDCEVALVTASPSVPDSWVDQLKLSIGLLTWTVPTVHTLEQAPTDPNTVCVFVDDPQSPVLANPDPARFAGLKMVCTGSKGVLWLTRGGTGACANPLASLAAGFLRTLRQEYSGKPLGTLDLDPSQLPWSPESIRAITDVFGSLFDQSSTESARDFEFAERDGVIHIPRYVKDVERNQAAFSQPGAGPATRAEPFLQPDRPLRLTIGTTGQLDTVVFDDDLDAMLPLPDDFVEIEPRAFGVDSRDALVAMGQLKSQVMGYDCAGVVKRVSAGAAAMGYRPGDRVAVLLPGQYASRVRARWSSVVHIPNDMSFEVAASLPTEHVTAYLSLYDTARLQPGETILIHSATDGVGQAAVALAQRVGAEVFVTVGSEAKRQFAIEHHGIQADHILSGEDASFAAGLMEMTSGKGVDVVLNSLTGHLLQESFNCLAPFGRFVELGKRDSEMNNSLAMEAFTRAVSFSSIDVAAFAEHKPVQANRILKQVVKLVAGKEVEAVKPVTVYPLSEMEKAFRVVQDEDHVGKVVLAVTPETMVSVSLLAQFSFRLMMQIISNPDSRLSHVRRLSGFAQMPLTSSSAGLAALGGQSATGWQTMARDTSLSSLEAQRLQAGWRVYRRI